MDTDEEFSHILQIDIQEIKKICEKLPSNKLQTLYIFLLNQLAKSIVDDNVATTKKVSTFMEYLTGIIDNIRLKKWFTHESNALRTTNLLILCSKFNRIQLLSFFLIENKCVCLMNLSHNGFPLPKDTDDEQHNAFYYAIGNGNIDLIQILLEHWPNKFFDETKTDYNDMVDKILATCYEELTLKNVLLSEEITFFITKKLFNLRFKMVKRQQQLSNKVNLKEQLKHRINLVLDNITAIVSEYSNGKKFDQKLLFLCRSLAKDIEILKRKLKSTYSDLPWEEIEFIIVAYVLSQTKRNAINLVYLMTFRNNTFFKHLEYFGHKLKTASDEFLQKEYEITDLPDGYRHFFIERLKDSDTDKQYRDLVNDFETMRDAYSFDKILEAIEFALALDSSDYNASLILVNSLQTIGELMKNSWESPNLSPDSLHSFLFSIPKNIHGILVTLRNSFSHAGGLCKRNELIANARKDGGAFVGRIQEDLKQIKKQVKQGVHRKELNLIMEILREIKMAQNINEMRKTIKLMERIDLNFEQIKVVEQNISKSFNLQEIIAELISLAEDTEENRKILDQIKDLSGKAENELRLFQNKRLYMLIKFESFKFVEVPNAFRIFKKLVPNVLHEIAFSEEHRYLKEIVLLMQQIKNNTRCYEILKEDTDIDFFKKTISNINKLEELKYKVLSFVGVKCTGFGSVEDLKHQLCYTNSNNVDKPVQETNESLRKLFSNKFDELQQVVEKIDVSDKSNFLNYKTSILLRKSLEIIFLDIMSIFEWTNRKANKKVTFFSKPAFLDTCCPLLTGIQMRNYLAHKPALFEILNINTSMLTICNAEKFLEEFKKRHFDKGQNWIIGNYVYEDGTKVRANYEYKQGLIKKMELFYEMLERGHLIDVRKCLKDGADLKARDFKLRTPLHQAAKQNNLETIKFLISQGLSVDPEDSKGYTPLHLSIKYNCPDVSKLFFQKCNKSEKNWLTLKISIESGSFGMVELLIKNGVNYEYLNNTPFLLLSIMKSGNSKIAIILLEHGILDINAKIDGGCNYLKMASELGMTLLMFYLIEKGLDIHETDERGSTCLHAAALFNHYEIVEILLSKGADPNFKCVEGKTPLMAACEGGNEKIIEILLKHGADASISSTTLNSTALHGVCINGHDKGLELLLRNKNVDINAKTSDLSQSSILHIQRYHSVGIFKNLAYARYRPFALFTYVCESC